MIELDIAPATSTARRSLGIARRLTLVVADATLELADRAPRYSAPGHPLVTCAQG